MSGIESRNWNPLLFTYDISWSPKACSDITLTYIGGEKPYSLGAFYYPIANASNVQWQPICTGITDQWYTWTVAVPINSNVFFQLKDASGTTIFSSVPIEVVTNGMGRAKDVWCFSNEDDDTVQGSNVTGHNYAMNGTDDNPSSSPTQHPSSSIATGAAAAAASASSASAALEHDSAMAALADSREAKARVVEGVLAALFAVALLSFLIVLGLFVSLRRQYRRAQAELDRASAPLPRPVSEQKTNEKQTPGGNAKAQTEEMTEKPRGLGFFGRKRRKAAAAARPLRADGGPTPQSEGLDFQRGHNLMDIGLEDETDDDNGHDLGINVITPTADPRFINPFDEAVAAVRNGDTRFLAAAGFGNGAFRNSTTSLASDVPSSNGGSVRTGVSGISTEFYHRTKASTIPPKATGPARIFSALPASSSSASSSSPISPTSDQQQSSPTAVASSRSSDGTLKGKASLASSGGFLSASSYRRPLGASRPLASLTDDDDGEILTSADEGASATTYGPHSPSIQSVETVIVPISRTSSRDSVDHRPSSTVASSSRSSNSGAYTEDERSFTERRIGRESRNMSFSGQSWGGAPSMYAESVSGATDFFGGDEGRRSSDFGSEDDRASSIGSSIFADQDARLQRFGQGQARLASRWTRALLRRE